MRDGLAYIAIACFILFPSLAESEYGSSLFGEHPIIKLLSIAGAGGGLSGALFGGRRRWLIGLISGAVAGVGAAGAFTVYASGAHKKTFGKGEVILTLGVGAIPGVLLAVLLSYITKRKP
jgi:hypothetical protein